MTGTRDRFAEVVRGDPVDLGLACLLVGGEVEPGLDVEPWLGVLSGLAARARREVPVDCPAVVAAEGLRVALGGQAGYGGSAADYRDVRSSLLHEVLRRGSGLPLLLSVLWVEVARRLGVRADPVALPGHVVVALRSSLGAGREDVVYVDPFEGGRLRQLPELATMVQAATGGPLRPEHLEPAQPIDLLLRLLTNVRALASRQAAGMDAAPVPGAPGRAPAVTATLAPARTQLWAVELSLLLPRHPVALRHERGELLVRVGDHVTGARELEVFAEIVEDADPLGAETARGKARLARAQLN